MPMTKLQAIDIIELVSMTYNIEFEENKAKVWIDIISEKGDYEPSMKKTRNYIANNSYKPKIADLIAQERKQEKIEEVLDDSTKRHRWLMENDPAYKRKRDEALDEFKKKLREFRSEEE